MRKNKKSKVILLTILIVGVLLMSVAFAALSTTLTIRGTGLVDPVSWDIKFENLASVTLKGTAQETTAPTIKNYTEISEYAVVLKQPGDEVRYDFDVHNYGQVDAKIETLNVPTPVCSATASDEQQKIKDAEIVSNNLTYTLKYKSGEDLKVGDILKAGEVKSLVLTLKFEADELPSASVQISGLEITLTYSQSTGSTPIEPEIPEVDLSQKTSAWFGDSLMYGLGNTRSVTNAFGYEVPAGMPTYYRDLTNAELSKTYNCGVGGSTITNNTPNQNNANEKLTVEWAINHMKSLFGQSVTVNGENNTIPQGEDYDFVMLEGGGNDVLAYEMSTIDATYKKEIGTAEDTTTDTVVNDFRKVIQLAKETFPNAKLVFMNSGSLDRTALELIGIKSYFKDQTVEEINQTAGTNFANMEELRNAIYRDERYAEGFKELRDIIDTMEVRAQAMKSELPKVCRELGVDYLEMYNVIEANRPTDGSDTNTYLQADRIHITHEGYTAIAPSIVNKIKSIF